MLQFPLQWLRDLIRAIFNAESPTPHPTEITPLTNDGYESLFYQMLEGVAQGWQCDDLVHRLGIRQHDPWFVSWLHRYGKSLLRQSPQYLNREMAQRMMRLGNLGCGELGDVSAGLGRRLLNMSDRAALNAPQATKPATVITSDDPHELFKYGLELYTTGELDGAMSLWRTALEQRPKFEQAENACGVALYYQGQRAEALAQFEQLLSHHPDSDLGHFNQGNLLLGLGRFTEAIAHFTHGIEQGQDLSYYAYLGRGHAYHRLGDHALAWRDYEAAIALRPDWPWGYTGRGMVTLAWGDGEAAIADFSQALHHDPNDHYAYHGRGLAWQALGRHQAAVEDFTQVILLAPNLHQAYYNRGNSYADLGHYGKAIADYKEAIALQPQSVFALNGRGLALSKTGQTEAALADFTTALALDSDCWQAWVNRGWTLYNAPDQGPTAALQNWETAINELQHLSHDRALALGTLAHAIGLVFGKVAQTQPKQARPLLERAIAALRRSLDFLQDQPNLEAYYLEVMTDLIVTYQRTGSILNTKNHLNIALLIINQLQLNAINLSQKRRWLHQLRGIYQLKVEQLSQAIDPKQRLQAIELAEERRNALLQSQLNPDWDGQILPPPTYSQMQQLLTEETGLLYWHISPASITLFVVLHRQPLQVIQGNYDQLSQFRDWWQQWSSLEFVSEQHSQQPEDDQHWRNQLLPRLAELGEILQLAQVWERLPEDLTHLIIVPHQELHLVPLHLAINHPQFDHLAYVVTYLPSVQMGLTLLQHQHDHPLPAVRSLLTIAGSAGVSPHATTEVAIVAQFFEHHSIDPGQATPTQVQSALATAVELCHFAGDAWWDGTWGETSGLQLANDRQVAIAQLKHLDAPTPPFVCLSGHWLQLGPDFRLDLEGLGFPTVFLHQGSSHVVVSLWPVGEISTALLMGYMYALLKDNITPAIALHQSQNWLQTLTYQDLLHHYETLLKHLTHAAPPGLDHLKIAQNLAQAKAERLGPTICPYAHPYYWAGFTITGLPYGLHTP
ncbi:tetratricopeptide repeat protein [Spirulina major CS-329]|uniref:tetratricopeptide repeat protein n=1 Tax=Spirulina TaxID=1154 RepID=UPI00232DB5AF|nr:MULTISPECIES: tetratricopeptide repeat protein [Spirulina]MDB9497067.1 tetratricopeptide repeat protein [Spirulina subsalsa CS-330]MDB9503650.1 tetratricopeptide repeat protein [Spirulina major CS-329]